MGRSSRGNHTDIEMLGLEERDPPIFSIRRKLVLAIACMMVFVLYVGVTCHPLFVTSMARLARAEFAATSQASEETNQTHRSSSRLASPTSGGSLRLVEEVSALSQPPSTTSMDQRVESPTRPAPGGVIHLRGERGNIQVKWVFNSSDVFSGIMFGVGHQGCVTVWDVDGDGSMEAVYGTRRGNSRRLWCVGDDGSFEWVFPPITEDGLPGDPTSKVSLVDVDNDGVYELCFAGRGGRLFVLNGDGTVKWTWDNPDPGTAMHGAPQAFDVDGDGHVEFFMNSNSGFIDRVDHRGNHVWRSFKCGEDNQGHPTIADVDRDGNYEVLWASQDHWLYCIDAQTAMLKWKVDLGANMKCQPPIVADVNGDRE